jgi:hypothetical protein
MNLATAITDALDCTSRLLDAVVQEDHERCPALLVTRHQAMTRFESQHKNASAEEQQTCAGLLDELMVADKTLQEASSILRDRLGGEFRGLMSSGPVARNSGYSAPTSQACVDRKA